MTQYLALLAAVLGIASTSLTALVAHVNAPPAAKAYVLLGFSIASGAITEAARANGPFTWSGFLDAAGLAFTAGVVAHKGQLVAPLNTWLAAHFPGWLAAPTPLPPAFDPRALIDEVQTPPSDPAAGSAGLLVLAVVLLFLFGGLGFVAHVLWLGLIVAVIVGIAAAVTRS